MKWFLFFGSLLFALTGFAEDQAEAFKIQTTTYNFGFQMVNSSRSVTFDILNTGTTDLIPESNIVRGASFSARHSCLKVLKPQESCQVTIRFTPLFEGLFSGSFESYFQGGTGVVIRLWGQGQRL